MNTSNSEGRNVGDERSSNDKLEKVLRMTADILKEMGNERQETQDRNSKTAKAKETKSWSFKSPF